MVLSYPLSAQQRLWSDWVDAQADLSLRKAHMPLCWFCHEVAQMYLLWNVWKTSLWWFSLGTLSGILSCLASSIVFVIVGRVLHARKTKVKAPNKAWLVDLWHLFLCIVNKLIKFRRLLMKYYRRIFRKKRNFYSWNAPAHSIMVYLRKQETQQNQMRISAYFPDVS